MANFTAIQSSLGTNEFTTNTERSIVKAATFSSGSPQLTQGYARYTIDATTLPAGSVIEVRRYLTAGPSGTQRQVDIATIRAAQVIEVDMGLLVEPWDVTIKLIAGASPQTLGYVVKQDINQVSITDGAIASATLAASAVTAIQSGLALSATALSTVQWTNARAALVDNLDAAISSALARLPAALDGSGNIKAAVQSLASGALDSIFAYVVEPGAPSGSQTFLQGVRAMWSVLLRKASGLAITTPGTEHFRNGADTKDVVVATLGSDGTRAVTVDGT